MEVMDAGTVQLGYQCTSSYRINSVHLPEASVLLTAKEIKTSFLHLYEQRYLEGNANFP